MSDITYTMQDVDDAMRAIYGDELFAVITAGHWSRPHRMQDAAVRAWVENRPEDRHSAVLRAAIIHMNKTGVILPEDRR